MIQRFATVQFSTEQVNLMALYQKYHRQIKYHIEKGLWDKQDHGKWLGSYTVNMKPDTGEIDNAVGLKHFGS